MTLVEEVRHTVGMAASNVGVVVAEAEFFPAQQIYDAINAALFVVWAEVQHDSVVGTSTATASAEFMNVPSNVMIPKQPVVGGRVMDVSHLQDLARYSPQWRKHEMKTDVPDVVVMWDVGAVTPYPLVSDEWVMVVEGVGWPPEVGTSTQDLDIDPTLKCAVVAFAGSVLVEDTHPNLADLLWGEGEEHIKEYRRYMRNTAAHRPTLLRPSSKDRRGVVKGRRFV